MIELNGIHLLLTYQCTFECEHCFAWGSPWQTGTMTIETIRKIISQAKEDGSIEWIYFEGGEPFLYYQLMIAGVNFAHALGFKVGIVTNSYWATSEEDAELCLLPLVDKVHDLTISSDLFHFSTKVSRQSEYVRIAAERLKIPLGVICIEQPDVNGKTTYGQIPAESASIMYRGRAVEKLVKYSILSPMTNYTSCPHEYLSDPGRVHIDPFGNLQICQGISIGNLFSETISDICKKYSPTDHPIIGPLIKGGPKMLVDHYHLDFAGDFADACHLCYESRKALRNRFPEYLLPDQMYGLMS